MLRFIWTVGMAKKKKVEDIEVTKVASFVGQVDIYLNAERDYGCVDIFKLKDFTLEKVKRLEKIAKQ